MRYGRRRHEISSMRTWPKYLEKPKTPHNEPTANRDEIETNPTKTTDERTRETANRDEIETNPTKTTGERTRETANRQEQDKRKLSAKTRKTQCV